jgi:hypothetical protein
MSHVFLFKLAVFKLCVGRLEFWGYTGVLCTSWLLSHISPCVDGCCLTFLFESIFLQNVGTWDAGAEGGGRITSALQYISAIATGQVKLPLYTGSALSRLALFSMVHSIPCFWSSRAPSAVRDALVLSTGPVESLPSYSEPSLACF